MSEYRLGFFEEPYDVARHAGMWTGAFTTYLISCPGILLDWLFRHLRRCYGKPETKEEELAYTICTVDIPELFVNDRIFALDEDNEVIQFPNRRVLYSGGLIAKYPLGLTGEIAGTLVNTVISGAVFMAGCLLKAALYTAAAGIVVPFLVGGLLIAGAIVFVRGLYSGFHQTFTDIFEGGFERLRGLI